MGASRWRLGHSPCPATHTHTHTLLHSHTLHFRYTHSRPRCLLHTPTRTPYATHLPVDSAPGRPPRRQSARPAERAPGVAALCALPTHPSSPLAVPAAPNPRKPTLAGYALPSPESYSTTRTFGRILPLPLQEPPRGAQRGPEGQQTASLTPISSRHHPHAFPFSSKNQQQQNRPEWKPSCSVPKAIFKNFSKLQKAVGSGSLHAPLPPAGPPPERSRLGPGPGEAGPRCRRRRAAACLALSRPEAAKTWDRARGQPLGPGPARPFPAPGPGRPQPRGGPGGRKPRRHAVEKARRCRRLSRRSPAAAAAAASPLPPGPARGGQGPARPAAASAPPPKCRVSPYPPRNRLLSGGPPPS